MEILSSEYSRLLQNCLRHDSHPAGLVRYWLGAGRGDFGISSNNTFGTSFYCLMTTLKEGTPTFHPGSDYLRGRKVKISNVPIKDPYFSTLKSVNYLPNALACMDGEQDGLDCVRPLSKFPH